MVVGFGLPLARSAFDLVGGLFRGVDCGTVGDVPELVELAKFASMISQQVNRHPDSCIVVFQYLSSYDSYS